MASLGTSQVTPIRMFGIYAAIGIVVSIPVMLLLMPSVLYLLNGRLSNWSTGENQNRRQRSTGVSNFTSLMIHRGMSSSLGGFGSSDSVAVGLSCGMPYLKGSVKLQNRFADRTKIIQDYQWLETNLGALVPMEVVIRFGPDNKLPSWQQMLVIRSIEDSLLEDPLVAASLSAAAFKPNFPRGNNARARLARQIGIEAWQNKEANLIDAKMILPEDDGRLWRISLRVAALNDIDYGVFLDTVETKVREKLATLDQPDVSAVFSGGIPLFYHAQHQILRDLKNSFITAFIFISIVLMIVLRSFSAGLVAMIPNVFPPLFVFGAMGWLRLPIEIGSVMTASVALGIAVDDTIHFLTWYRRGVGDNRSRLAAIRYAFEHCAKPMIDTTLICGFGVAAFMFADFMPTVRFSRLLFVLLMAALIGDLILLPAILAGPAGKLFRKQKNSMPDVAPVKKPARTQKSRKEKERVVA